MCHGREAEGFGELPWKLKQGSMIRYVFRKTTLTTVWKMDSSGVRLAPGRPSSITVLI